MSVHRDVENVRLRSTRPGAIPRINDGQEETQIDARVRRQAGQRERRLIRGRAADGDAQEVSAKRRAIRINDRAKALHWLCGRHPGELRRHAAVEVSREDRLRRRRQRQIRQSILAIEVRVGNPLARIQQVVAVRIDKDRDAFDR